MEEVYYPLKVLDSGSRFDFLSEGLMPTHKAIFYSETEIPFLYSLALTEVQHDGRFVTTINNSNRDVKITMATVFKTVEAFTNANPRAVVGFTGNTEVKTRLYRIAISRDLDKFLTRYFIWGVRSDNGKREAFRPNQPYQFYFVSRRFLT